LFVARAFRSSRLVGGNVCSIMLPKKITQHMSLPFLNRDAYLVKPKKKYTDWVCYVDETARSEDVDNLLASAGTIYLLEELDTGGSAEAETSLNRHWRGIAESEFESWWTNEADWPKLKCIADFEEYFSWTYVEMVYDLSTGRLTRE
jgi:hypothetical protein